MAAGYISLLLHLAEQEGISCELVEWDEDDPDSDVDLRMTYTDEDDYEAEIRVVCSEESVYLTAWPAYGIRDSEIDSVCEIANLLNDSYPDYIFSIDKDFDFQMKRVVRLYPTEDWILAPIVLTQVKIMAKTFIKVNNMMEGDDY